MLNRVLNHRSARICIAVCLLCAMLLAACGTLPSLPALPDESIGQTPRQTPQSAPDTSAPQAEPTPEPEPEPTPIPFSTPVVLSELQSSNKSTLPDRDGGFSDWIELYNPSSESAELTGCWLSDDANEPYGWQFPELTLAPGEYRVIYCSGHSRSDGELHASFKLSSKGDTLCLSSPEGVSVWSVSFGECGSDSVLRFEGEDAYESVWPTPGYPNTDEGYERFVTDYDRHGPLMISEAASYNETFYFHAGGYYDWIELKNSSAATITLSDYYITDDSDDPFAFRLPETTLAPGMTFVVYCGEPLLTTASCHAPFKLNSGGDSVFLYYADGSLCDYMSLYNVPLNHSRGRIDGRSGPFLFPTRTPAAANGYGARMISERPESVTRAGVYNGVNGVDVELSGEGAIYYTLNGNLPDTSSYLYTGPIHLTSTTVVRAASYADGKLRSETATFTYVINEGHNLPVVCIALEPMKFNVLYYHNGNLEYDSHTEFYDLDGGSFESDCAVTLHGAASRSAWAKKSFKVVFRDRYGGDINYDLFGQGITEFHSLNLRGGDSVDMKTFREPLSAEFAERVAVQDPMALDSRFCVLYINGQYYGLYTLREAYSKKYVESHTGSDEELVSISRAPIQIEYQPELYRLHNFIVSCDINNPDNYQYIADRLDMESMAQWLLLETYFNNLDPTGNIRYSIGNQPDNKWRTMFFDLDISMTNEHASIYPMIETGSQIGRMYTNLLRSSEFKQVLLETASGLYRNGLSYKLALEILDRMVEETLAEMPRNLQRWGESEQLYQFRLASQKSVFTQARDNSWLEIVKIYTGADDATMAAYFPER